jgi:hypothetical protein
MNGSCSRIRCYRQEGGFSTGFVESAVNYVIAKRFTFTKRQQMQYLKKGNQVSLGFACFRCRARCCCSQSHYAVTSSVPAGDPEVPWQIVIFSLVFDRAQEFQKLAAAMPAVQLSDDVAGGNVECGKQGSCAMALVVVRAPFCDAGGQRQDRLGPVQCLYLAILIDAQHHGLDRQIDKQSNDDMRLFDKQWVGGELEGFLPMRLAEGAPDIACAVLRRRAQACNCSYSASFSTNSAFGLPAISSSCLELNIWETADARIIQRISNSGH